MKADITIPPGRSVPLRKKEALARVGAHAGLFALSRGVGQCVRDNLVILAYHRVVPGAEEWSWPFDIELISATPDEFRWQMQFIARHLKPITLSQLVAAVEGGPELPRSSVLVTFDDGFNDNYQYAYPILRDVGVPAAVFVSTDLIGTTQQFWFERVAHLIMAVPEGAVIEPLPGHPLAVVGGPPHRRGMVERVLAMLKHMPDARRQAFLQATEALHGVAMDRSVSDLSRILTWDEVRAMNAGGVEFGSHGASHGVLSRLTADVLAAELQRSKQRLTAELGNEPRAIAYPVGGLAAFDDAVIDAVRRAGFSVGMSYLPGANRRTAFDAFRLRRQHVERFTSRAFFEGLLSLPSLFR